MNGDYSLEKALLQRVEVCNTTVSIYARSVMEEAREDGEVPIIA